MDKDAPRKGTKTKLFGVILVFLGVLNSMLSWRGGFEVSEFYVLLFVCGILLYVIGTIRCGSRTRTDGGMRKSQAE